ncbi:DUF4153 domain-containing protein [Nocardia sp. NPDC058497]|uniref:DUF4153 domain-containing protein n=1 Tax=Nocardia sp. NPDC058497 TaxID=3346529 RepID=UPI0036489568
MTEKPTTPRTPDGPETAVTVADKPSSGTTSPAGQGSTDTPQPWTAGWQAAAAMPPVRPMPPLSPPPPPVPQRWQRVARPAGVLPAAAVAGIVGATVIPVDRPGIGWLLAGGVITGALCVVDYRARSRNTVSGDAAESAAETTKHAAGETGSHPSAMQVTVVDSAHQSAAAGSSTKPVAAGTERTLAKAATPETPASTGNSQSADSPAVGQSAITATDPADSPAAAEPATPGSDTRAAVETGTTGAATAEVQAAAQKPASNAQDAASTSAVEGSADSEADSVPSTGEDQVAVDAADTDQPAEVDKDSTAAGPDSSSPAVAASHTSSPEAGKSSPATPPDDSSRTVAPDDTSPGATVRKQGADNTSGRGNAPSADPVTARDRLWWTIAALALLGVGTVRAAGWLFVLCVLAACVAGSLAVLGRRTSRGIVHDMIAVPLASFGAVPWAFSGLREARPAELSSVRRYGVSVAATVALLVVFVPLLGGADATFADLLSGLVPTVDAATAWQWILLFGVVAVGALGALYLLAGPPAAAAASPRPARLWSRSEWVLPVGALTVLFAVFVGAQFVALFGGDDYVQRTAGLTYAEYARSGFWQLSAVSILTLAVILAVLRWSSHETAADRRWLRILLSAVSVLALVIVGSALARMWTYQQAYGFTVLRLLVEVCELWVGVVYVLVLVAIARLRWSWVPRAAVGTALATLIALAILNPEHLVAERNIDRWEHGKRLDTAYLSDLSPDIIPALTQLPPELRTEIEDPIRADLDDDHWWSWNFSRSSAR